MFGWKPYVPVAERRKKAAKKIAKLAKDGRKITPVIIEGRTVATTFWGKAWNQNLEAYSDYSNRLPRGRTYVRNGSVVDLQISPGEICALVSGSEIYEIRIQIKPIPKEAWAAICRDCAGGIESLVELLQGRLSKGVMERICRQQTGLFPSPKEIGLACSCPDWASMCKHVAAALYGVGARLDHQPELLFTLRNVEVQDLLASAGKALPLSKTGPSKGKVLEDESFADLFDLEMADTPSPKVKPAATPSKPRLTKAIPKVTPKTKAKTPVKAPTKAVKTAAKPPKVAAKPRKAAIKSPAKAAAKAVDRAPEQPKKKAKPKSGILA